MKILLRILQHIYIPLELSHTAHLSNFVVIITKEESNKYLPVLLLSRRSHGTDVMENEMQIFKFVSDSKV